MAAFFPRIPYWKRLRRKTSSLSRNEAKESSGKLQKLQYDDCIGSDSRDEDLHHQYLYPWSSGKQSTPRPRPHVGIRLALQRQSHEPMELAETLIRQISHRSWTAPQLEAVEEWKFWRAQYMNMEDKSESPVTQHPDETAMLDLISIFNRMFFMNSLPPLHFRWRQHLAVQNGAYAWTHIGRDSVTVSMDPEIQPADIKGGKMFVNICTLLHELVHAFLAYFACRGTCQKDDCTSNKYAPLQGLSSHGPAWQMLAAAIEKQASIWPGSPVDLGRRDMVTLHIRKYGVLPFEHVQALRKCFPDYEGSGSDGLDNRHFRAKVLKAAEYRFASTVPPQYSGLG